MIPWWCTALCVLLLTVIGAIAAVIAGVALTFLYRLIARGGAPGNRRKDKRQ